MPHGEALGSQEYINERTGLGVFIQYSRENKDFTVLVQASSANVSSPLLAETKGLLLATHIAAALQLSRPIFLTDNLALAQAAANLMALNVNRERERAGEESTGREEEGEVCL